MKKVCLIFVLPLIVIFSCSQSRKPSQGHSKAVVELRDKASYNIGKPMGNSKEDLHSFYEKHLGAVFSVRTSDENGEENGAGFLISDNGIAVSNYRVFANVSQVKERIRLNNGREYRVAEIISSSKDLGYVIFKLKTDSSEVFPFLTVAEKAPQIGENVSSIGSQGRSISRGIVTLLKNEDHLIETTAKLSPSNGGGPLLNKEGQVIGINLPSIARGELNFAIDIRILNLK